MDLLRDVEVMLDVMFVNKIPSLVSVSQRLTFITVQYLNRRTESQLAKGISHVRGDYLKRGLNVSTMYMDRELE